ncbi:serine hydrolase domain-containing protein [Flavobacterium sp.]|uniref:serine hydrolase domain-containing protein n=1 Tax=Flavobacterium sp. TaxID=239 RepID=UPI00286E45E3|nr:serine hydrolase domain-containing protein [Flavobacterium sp.]
MTSKNNTSIFLFLLTVFVFFSCKNDVVKIKTKEESKVGSLFTMQPYELNFPEIKTSEKKKLQNTIQTFYNDNYIPNDFSGSFLVAKNGHVVYECYRGMSNFEQQKAITKETPLHIASLSKILTATALFLLIDSKKITLDQKVNTILDDFPYPEITIRTLLNHRSGLRNYSYFTDKKTIWNQKNTLQNSDLITVINKNKIDLEYKSDTHFSYCNTNYAFLASIIEKITKMNYTDAMSELIFKPLKMKNTFVFDLKHKDTVSQSYKGNKVKYGFNYLDAIYGDKNIYSTPRDLLKFDLATYNPNFLNKKLIAEIYKGYSYESKGTRNYGLGIRMMEWEDGKKMFYHNGWWHGNTASYFKLKDEKTTLICISNKYTRSTYKIKLLSSLFGKYPYELKSKNDSLE